MKTVLRVMIITSVVALSLSPLILIGCAFGGAKETVTHVMVEAGSDALEVAQDKPIKVMSKARDGRALVSEKNCAGMVVSPKTVFRKLRMQSIQLQMFAKENPEAWKKFQADHPELFKEVEEKPNE